VRVGYAACMGGDYRGRAVRGRAEARLGRICAQVRQLRATLAAENEVSPGGLTVNRLIDSTTGARSSFGAEVRGLAAEISLHQSTPPSELSRAIQSLLTHHQVMVCRFEAPLTVAQMQWLVSLFGEVKDGWGRCRDGSMRQYLRYDHPSLPDELRYSGVMEHRSGLVIPPSQLNGKYGGTLTATGGTASRPFVYEGFHTDDSYTEQPAGSTMLHARELPPSGGGDTIFIDMVSACRQLPQGHQLHTQGEDEISVAALRGRYAEHAYNNHGAFASRPSAAGANDALVRPRHPLLRCHPRDPSRVALYLDLDRATGDVDGCHDLAEGQQLLQTLQDRAEADAPRYSHRWQEHDCIIWDNVSVQHAASSDFKIGESRTMWRCLL
jgi:alpha-ketoglutarate-dependent taurine dioxygenase